MKKYLWLLISFLMIGLTACGKEEQSEKAPERVGMDTSEYDIEDEIIYVKVLTNTRQYIEEQISKGNKANGLLRTATVYGNIDLLSIKQEVINRFNDVSHKNDEDRTLYVSEPFFEAVGKLNPQHTDYIDALIFHSIFNPQLQLPANENLTKELEVLGLEIAVTRADVPYWFTEIRKCVDKKIDTSKIKSAEDIPGNSYDIINACSDNYNRVIEAETAAIYTDFSNKVKSK
ncbi:MAG: hypothetical protein J6N49_05045 [Alphaproteobacteria bacterium]|nr:hypothetical protein [Alphaproteobacteria bacterium]